MRTAEILENVYAIPIVLVAMVSPEVEAGVVYVSTAASILGLATGVFNQKPMLTAGSIFLSSITYVGWKNLGAAAKNRGFKEGFEEGAAREKKEGEELDSLLKRLRTVEGERTFFEGEAGKLTQKNSKLSAELQLAREETAKLKQTEGHSAARILELNKELAIQKREIQKRELQEIAQRAKIEHLNKSVMALTQTGNKLKVYIESRDEEFTALHGRVVDLQKEVKRLQEATGQI